MADLIEAFLVLLSCHAAAAAAGVVVAVVEEEDMPCDGE